jgi:hypothetical protein
MTIKVRTIEIDAGTAEALEARAAAQGVSVSTLIAELMGMDRELGFAEGDVSELDRRWRALEGGEKTIPHDRVVEWLESWGTSTFKPWRRQ